MFKQIVSATALCAAVLSSLTVFAADDARSSIHITANIPNKQFHVQPRDPEFGRDEYMYHDPVKNELSILRQTFDVKHTNGSVNAYLQGGLPELTNGTDNIPLLVTFNNVALNSVSQEVVDDATSTPGTQAELVIRASAKLLPGQTGLYNADLTVIFDAVPRVSL